MKLALSTESYYSSHVEISAGRFHGKIWRIWCIECQTVLPRVKATGRNPSEVFTPIKWGSDPNQGRDSRW